MRVILFSLVIFLSNSCNNARNTTNNVSSNNSHELPGSWELTVFPNPTKTFAEIFTMNKPQLTFENGKLTGTSGCNRFVGNYSVEGNKLTIDKNLALTKMGCPNYEENLFIDALLRSNRYTIAKDNLSLFQDSMIVMTFGRAKQPH